MHKNKYLCFLFASFFITADGMDGYNLQDVIKTTSFFDSFMAGNCSCQNTVIEFCDYRDPSLRYGITVTKAAQLLERYKKYAQILKEPIEQLFKEAQELPLIEKSPASFLKKDLTLQEAEKIQIYYFYKLGDDLKLKLVQDTYLKAILEAISALRFGSEPRFNTAMHTIKRCGSPMPSIEERIEQYAKAH